MVSVPKSQPDGGRGSCRRSTVPIASGLSAAPGGLEEAPGRESRTSAARRANGYRRWRIARSGATVRRQRHQFEAPRVGVNQAVRRYASGVGAQATNAPVPPFFSARCRGSGMGGLPTRRCAVSPARPVATPTDQARCRSCFHLTSSWGVSSSSIGWRLVGRSGRRERARSLGHNEPKKVARWRSFRGDRRRGRVNGRCPATS